jgi:drug/metabolite transporter (DMT)-like permease
MAGSELASAVLGLASAASWGAGDFCGGLATKRAGVFAVVIGSQLAGGAFLLLMAVALKERMPPLTNLLWCGAAGLIGALGLLALYRALATGHMGTAAPVSAVVTAALPVLVGALVEGLPGALKLFGFGLAIASVWLVSQSGREGFEFRHLGLPLAAGVGFGLFLVVMNRVNAGAVFWPLLAARAASISALWIVARLTNQRTLPQMKLLPLAALTGLLDVGGNAFYVFASQAGRLDVAAVLSSLYPASTVLLAWLILKEHIARAQTFGIAMALVAIGMITV